MISADTLRLLMEVGVTGEALLRVTESIEKDNAQNVTPVTPNAARQARFRARQRALKALRNNVTSNVTPLVLRARVEGSSSSKEGTGKKRKNNTPSPREELETVLDPEHAAAVVEHRQKKRCPLTPRAAKMLAKQFAKTSDPNGAADTMLARGWTGFEPEWLEKPNGKATDGEVLYKFTTLEEVLTPEELERAMHG